MTIPVAAKLCINCKHYQMGASVNLPAAEYSTCRALIADDNTGLTRVDGRALVIRYKYCDGARRDGGDCGSDAKLFASAQVTEAA